MSTIVSPAVQAAMQQLDLVLKDVVLNYKKMGGILCQFSGEDRKRLEEYLSKRYVSANDIRMAEALHTGRLAEGFCAPGMPVPVHKLLRLTGEQQKSLLDPAKKFPLASMSGPYEKAWCETSVAEKNLLLGKDGIRSLREQEAIIKVNHEERVILCKKAVSFSDGCLYFSISHGKVGVPLESFFEAADEFDALDECRSLLAKFQVPA